MVGKFLEWLANARGLGVTPQVLDIGCGPGRMFSAFRKLGWAVSSMEPDPEFLELAAQAARDAGYAPPAPGGFLELDTSASYDLVTAINDPFAYLLTGSERADAAARVFRALRSGGAFFLDVPNFTWILKNYREPAEMRAEIQGGEVRLMREHIIDFHGAVFTTIERYRVVKDGMERASSMTHPFAMTTFPEIAYHLESAGFRDLETYSSYEARAVESLDGPRLMISARRP